MAQKKGGVVEFAQKMGRGTVQNCAHLCVRGGRPWIRRGIYCKGVCKGSLGPQSNDVSIEAKPGEHWCWCYCESGGVGVWSVVVCFVEL